jgi:hypothetical protein
VYTSQNKDFSLLFPFSILFHGRKKICFKREQVKDASWKMMFFFFLKEKKKIIFQLSSLTCYSKIDVVIVKLKALLMRIQPTLSVKQKC